MVFPRAEMVSATDDILTDNGVRSPGFGGHAGDLEREEITALDPAGRVSRFRA